MNPSEAIAALDATEVSSDNLEQILIDLHWHEIDVDEERNVSKWGPPDEEHWGAFTIEVSHRFSILTAAQRIGVRTTITQWAAVVALRDGE